MHLPRLGLTKNTSKEGPAFSSNEVQRVLSMGIPVAVVVKLPSVGGTFQPNKTDLLLYFPSMYSVSIYEYTRNQGRAEFKFIGHCGDDVELPDTYQYTIELTPFLIAHGDSRNDGNTIFSFFIDCASVGYKALELRLLYKDKDRNDEWLELYWWPDDSRSSKGELIARWTPRDHIDKDSHYNSYLVWKTTEGKKLKKDEEVPHIRGYHQEDDEYED